MLQDWRDPGSLEAREGFFLELLPEEAIQGGLRHAVTRALAERLRGCGRFAEVRFAEPGAPEGRVLGSGEGTHPVDLLLEGEVATFYAERNTIKHPFLSLALAPLSLPLAALSGLRVLPSPATPLLPVSYRANLTLQLRLRDVRSGAQVWERTLEGIAEHQISAGAEFLEGRQAGLGRVTSEVLQRVVDDLAGQLPPAVWFQGKGYGRQGQPRP